LGGRPARLVGNKFNVPEEATMYQKNFKIFLAIVSVISIFILQLFAFDQKKVDSWFEKEVKGKNFQNKECAFKVMLQLRHCLDIADYNLKKNKITNEDYKIAEDECFQSANNQIADCK